MIRTLLLATAVIGYAQSFEVASIKPHRGEVTISADPSVRGNRVVGTASTLADMITNAYGVRYGQVAGGPGWITTDHFDVDAKAPDGTALTPELGRVMMQALLAERFGFKLHRETRQVPVYALVVGPKGAKLKESAPDTVPAGFVRGAADGSLHMEARRRPLDRLTDQLSYTAGRPVIDRTGLTALYDFDLDWFPANRVPPADSTVPSMFVAVQEQLGLRLESSTGPQEFLVIDQATRPTDN